MRKSMTARTFSYTAVLYFIGNAYILGSDRAAGRNSWLALGICAVLYVPLLCLYGNLASRYPGCGFFEICEKTIGRRGASVAAVLYIFYGVGVFSMSLSCLSRFVSADILPETPKIVMAVLTAFCAVLLVCAGEENMGKWAAFILPGVLAVISASLLISVKSLHPGNLRPLAWPLRDTLTGVYRYAAFPFGEPIAMLGLLRGVGDGIKPRHLLLPWLLSSVVLIVTLLRNSMVLGGALSGWIDFASFLADSVAGYNMLHQRIEAVTSIIPAVSAVLEAAVILFFVQEALRFLIGEKRRALSVSLLAAAGTVLCMLLYTNSVRLEKRAMLWPAISVPLQILLPFAAWISCIMRGHILHNAGTHPSKKRQNPLEKG